MKVKPGTIHSVENKDKKNAAAKQYNMMVIDDTNEVLFFTDSDLMKALDRASKNKEDIPRYRVRKSVDWDICAGFAFTTAVGGVTLGYFMDFFINKL